MDIYAAQKMFGRGRTFDRIDIGAAGRDGRLRRPRPNCAALLGPGFQVDPPSGRGQQFEAMTAAYSMMVNISSLFALFIGMFIIYNSFAIAVTQRRSEIGILRALGATRAADPLAVSRRERRHRPGRLDRSACCSVCVIARGIAASIGDLMSDVYGVAQRADEIATSPSLLGLALVDRHRDQHDRRA